MELPRNHEEIRGETSQQNNLYTKPTKTVTCAVINHITPPLRHVKQHLEELTDKQSDLTDRLHQSNLNISQVKNCDNLQTIFQRMKTYQNKLQTIKKDMKTIQERTAKLKARAIKLEEAPKEEVIVTKPTAIISSKTNK